MIWSLCRKYNTIYVKLSSELLRLHFGVRLRSPKRNGPQKLEVIHCVRGVISPTLANMVLDGLEALLKQRFRPKHDKGVAIPKINLIRYADDFIITGATKDVLENEVLPLVEQFMNERGLQLSPEKTDACNVWSRPSLPLQAKWAAY